MNVCDTFTTIVNGALESSSINLSLHTVSSITLLVLCILLLAATNFGLTFRDYKFSY
jgi:hypothetical protein